MNNKICPVTYTLSIIGGKWKPIILYLISKGANRFGILHRGITGISKQMLTNQLRELEQSELISRTIFAEIPPRVEYELTGKGNSIMTVIAEMKKWGEKYLREDN